MEESKLIDFIVILLKLLAYLVTFAIVLGGAVISKASLLFMTSQIEPNQKKPYCNKDLGMCVPSRKKHTENMLSKPSFLAKTKQFVVELPQVERVAWIWVIVFAFFVPELGTFIRSVRICCFKSWKLPKNNVVYSIFITESLPTIGSAILVFCVLPNLDVVKGVMLTNSVCFVPAVIGKLFQHSRISYLLARRLLYIKPPMQGIVVITHRFSLLPALACLLM